MTFVRVRALTVVLACLVGASSCATASTTSEAPKRLGILRAIATAADDPGAEQAMFDELQRAGFARGRTLEVLNPPDEVHVDEGAAAEAVRRWERRSVDLVVAFFTAGAAAAKASGRSPVAFLVNDPVATGLVTDRQRPDGRLTGVTFTVPADRTLDLARRAIPSLRTVGMAVPVADAAAGPNRDAFAAAAAELGLAFRAEPFDGPEDAARAVGVLADGGVEALVLSTSPSAIRALRDVEAAAKERRLPTVANVDLSEGAILALYPDREVLGRQLGRQAVRLLNGDSPSEIPVEDPRRFTLALDLAAAAGLGLTLPETMIREASVVKR